MNRYKMLQEKHKKKKKSVEMSDAKDLKKKLNKNIELKEDKKIKNKIGYGQR